MAKQYTIKEAVEIKDGITDNKEILDDFGRRYPLLALASKTQILKALENKVTARQANTELKKFFNTDDPKEEITEEEIDEELTEKIEEKEAKKEEEKKSAREGADFDIDSMLEEV